MLQHAMLMNTRFVCERVLTDDGLVAWQVHARDIRDESGGRVQAGRIDPGFEFEELSTRLDCHYSFFERTVARAFADTVDRALNLARASSHRSQAVGDSHAEIIVAVHAQRNLIDACNMLLQVAKQAVKLRRDRVAHCVRNIHRRRTGFDGRRDNLSQVGQFRARGILRRELDIIDEFTRQLDRTNRALDDLFLGHLELVLSMYGARRDKDMYPVPVGAFDSVVDFLDIAGIAPGKTTDHRAEVALGDCLDGLEIARRCSRKTGLDDVDV